MPEFECALRDKLSVDLAQVGVIFTVSCRRVQELAGNPGDILESVRRGEDGVRTEILRLRGRVDTVGITEPEVGLLFLSCGDRVQWRLLVIGGFHTREYPVPPFGRKNIIGSDLRYQCRAVAGLGDVIEPPVIHDGGLSAVFGGERGAPQTVHGEL